MSDEIIEDLWRIKDGIAREHGYDVRAPRRRSSEPGTGVRPAGRGLARRAGGPRTRRAGRTAVRGWRIARATAVPSFAVR